MSSSSRSRSKSPPQVTRRRMRSRSPRVRPRALTLPPELQSEVIQFLQEDPRRCQAYTQEGRNCAAHVYRDLTLKGQPYSCRQWCADHFLISTLQGYGQYLLTHKISIAFTRPNGLVTGVTLSHINIERLRIVATACRDPTKVLGAVLYQVITPKDTFFDEGSGIFAVNAYEENADDWMAFVQRRLQGRSVSLHIDLMVRAPLPHLLWSIRSEATPRVIHLPEEWDLFNTVTVPIQPLQTTVKGLSVGPAIYIEESSVTCDFIVNLNHRCL